MGVDSIVRGGGWNMLLGCAFLSLLGAGFLFQKNYVSFSGRTSLERAEGEGGLSVRSASGRSLKSLGNCADCAARLQELRTWFADFKADQVIDSDIVQKIDESKRSSESARGNSDAAESAVKGGSSNGHLSLLASASDPASLKKKLDEKVAELEALRLKYSILKTKFSKVNYDKFILDLELGQTGADWGKKALTPEAMKAATELLQKCGQQNGMVVSKKVPVWKGYACSAKDDELQRYFDYEPRKACPDDWFLVQDLIYVKNCFALPKRRCLNRTPKTFKEPLPLPQSLFEQRALIDENVRWDLHWCKSFNCLNTRSLGDCRNCFNLTLEANRWHIGYRGSLTIKQVVEMKKGTLRLGLDAGGGTGSFAAHMARHNVTMMTTAMNIETVIGRKQGLPYMETIALRGLVPLWVPHKSRLPFFDNTLDIIHCVNSIKYLPMLEFEELLFEWDRVLRVGGVMWFEMFYAPLAELPVYVKIIDLLGYKKLYWNITPKPDTGERTGAHMYLNCLIEKPVRKD